PERSERAGVCEGIELTAIGSDPGGKIRHRQERSVRAFALDAHAGVLAQSADVAKPKPESAVLDRAFPVGMRHVDRKNTDAVALGILDQGGRMVEAERVAVEHRGEKRGRMM